MDSVRFLDPPRDPHFRDDSRERGWDSRCGVVGSRFNDKNIKARKQFFENYPIPGPAGGSLKTRRDAYEKSLLLKDPGSSGWDYRCGVTVSRMNNSMYPMMREYFDKPLQLNSDGTRSSKPGKLMNNYTPADRQRLLRSKAVKKVPQLKMSQTAPLLHQPPRVGYKVPLTPQAGEEARPGTFEELMEEQDERKAQQEQRDAEAAAVQESEQEEQEQES